MIPAMKEHIFWAWFEGLSWRLEFEGSVESLEAACLAFGCLQEPS